MWARRSAPSQLYMNRGTLVCRRRMLARSVNPKILCVAVVFVVSRLMWTVVCPLVDVKDARV